MAYIKELVRQQERRTFTNSYGLKKTPMIWTIDKEKDYILFDYLEDREPPHNNYFIFYYKGYTIDFMVHQRIFTAPNIITWKLLSIHIPDELDTEELLSELESAFLCFGYDGLPFNDDSKYIIKFDRGAPKNILKIAKKENRLEK